MQLYLKQVLEAFFHTQSSVRHFALNVIALTLNQGLIHPVQVSWRTPHQVLQLIVWPIDEFKIYQAMDFFSSYQQCRRSTF